MKISTSIYICIYIYIYIYMSTFFHLFRQKHPYSLFYLIKKLMKQIKQAVALFFLNK